LVLSTGANSKGGESGEGHVSSPNGVRCGALAAVEFSKF